MVKKVIKMDSTHWNLYHISEYLRGMALQLMRRAEEIERSAIQIINNQPQNRDSDETTDESEMDSSDDDFETQSSNSDTVSINEETGSGETMSDITLAGDTLSEYDDVSSDSLRSISSTSSFDDLSDF